MGCAVVRSSQLRPVLVGGLAIDVSWRLGRTDRPRASSFQAMSGEASAFSLTSRRGSRRDQTMGMGGRYMSLNRFIATVIAIAIAYLVVFGIVFPAFSTEHGDPSPGPPPTMALTPRP